MRQLTGFHNFSTLRCIVGVGAIEQGALRQRVLWIVREQGPCGAPDVCAILRRDRDISLNTVQTVLNRLVSQGVLTRSGSRRHYVYAVQPSEDAVKQHAERAARDLLSITGEMGFAHFLDTIDEIHPKAIEKLERLLAERRERGDKS